MTTLREAVVLTGGREPCGARRSAAARNAAERRSAAILPALLGQALAWGLGAPLCAPLERAGDARRGHPHSRRRADSRDHAHCGPSTNGVASGRTRARASRIRRGNCSAYEIGKLQLAYPHDGGQARRLFPPKSYVTFAGHFLLVLHRNSSRRITNGRNAETAIARHEPRTNRRVTPRGRRYRGRHRHKARPDSKRRSPSDWRDGARRCRQESRKKTRDGKALRCL
jgi:hypothetical protein